MMANLRYDTSEICIFQSTLHKLLPEFGLELPWNILRFVQRCVLKVATTTTYTEYNEQE